MRAAVDDPIIPLRFNPTEYQLQKTNNFAEIAIPGLESPPIQFVRGASRDADRWSSCVDTSDTLEDVREKYVDKLRGLMRIDTELHAPPIVRFIWDTPGVQGRAGEPRTSRTCCSLPTACRCAPSSASR